MVKPGTRPSTWRSSGMKPTPASRILRVERPTSSTPSRLIEPLTSSWRPRMASVSSVWPLPWTPATARTSPARMVKLRPSTCVWPARSTTRRSLTTSASSPSVGGVLVDDQLDRAADHHRGELGVAGLGVGLADDLAEADDGDPVGDLADLAELVGDEDDGLPGLLELAHDVHQLVGLLRGEHRGGLVEDEQLGVAGEGLDDLHALLHADGEVLDEGVGVDVEAEALGDLGDALAGLGEVERAGEAGGLVAEHDVLGDGEDGDEHEVLVDHADAGRHRVAGTGEVLDLAVELDLALVGLVEAVEHVHQRRLAGTVLAEEAVDLAGLHREGDRVVGHHAAEAFGDASQDESHGIAS